MNRPVVLAILLLFTLHTQAQLVPHRSIFALVGGIGTSSTLLPPQVSPISGPYVLQQKKAEKVECYDDEGNPVDCKGSGKHFSLGFLYRRADLNSTSGWMMYSDFGYYEQEHTLSYPSNRNFHIPLDCTPSIRRILRSTGASFSVGRYRSMNAGEGIYYARLGGRIATRFRYLRGLHTTRLPDLRPLEYMESGNGTIIEMYDNTPPYNILITPEIGISFREVPIEMAASVHLPVNNRTVYSELHTFSKNHSILGQNRVNYSNAVFNLTARLGVNLLRKYRRATGDTNPSSPVYARPTEPARSKSPTTASAKRFANQALHSPITLLVHFELTKANLLPESYPELNELAQWLNDNPTAVIRLEGHTDLVGNENKNLTLSRQRAVEVKKYLTLRGIASRRIKTAFFGENMPLNTNCPPPYYCPENRRVKMVILKR
jgi:outer membrane protein OmpA-like peptidoglycan-associated protein